MQVPMNFLMTQDMDGWYCIVLCNFISEVMEGSETLKLAIQLKRSIINHTLTGPCLAANHSCSNIASDLQEKSLRDTEKKKAAWYMVPVNVCPFKTNRNHNLPQLCKIHLHSILIVRYIFVLDQACPEREFEVGKSEACWILFLVEISYDKMQVLTRS